MKFEPKPRRRNIFDFVVIMACVTSELMANVQIPGLTILRTTRAFRFVSIHLPVIRMRCLSLGRARFDSRLLEQIVGIH